ncbi:MAG: tyrosine-type recombinase/integrase, partial [Peptostreptococcaceae bacterium]|nr:tyrosine-type recombinase/integrase [Peptostreptococcaceae bacterium]
KRKHLDYYLDVVSENYSVSTIKGKFSSLRGFFYFLQDDGLESDNPFRSFRLKMKTPVSIPASLTLGEVTRILGGAYKLENINAFQKTRDLLVLELLFFSGVRVSELCGIKLSDYNPVEKTMEVLGKGSRNRLVFITNKEVISLLNKYLSLRNTLSIDNANRLLSSRLLLSDKMLPIKTDQVRKIVGKYKSVAGMTKHVTPHTFRHTFASLLLEEDVDIKYIQEFLGHSSIKTTQIYLHTTNEKKRDILAKMHPRRKLGSK